MKFEEWEAKSGTIVFVSATPDEYELQQSGGEVVEQIIRPTGLLDPIIEVVPARGQVAHLLEESRKRIAVGERVLVTALTKRLAEDLSAYLNEQRVNCKWLHSELDAFERVELLRDLRQGHFDVLVGVNLLREGLDLPEVSLVAILDADKEGFLRSETSLIQTIGRAARNVNAKVILYADKMTVSMAAAIDETKRRRAAQEAYNVEHNITPETIKKNIREGIETEAATLRKARAAVGKSVGAETDDLEFLEQLQDEMLRAADELDFERAAQLRDKIKQLQAGKEGDDGSGGSYSVRQRKGSRRRGGGSGARIPRPKKG
jgi:excinuclease ABC subunit B